MPPPAPALGGQQRHPRSSPPVGRLPPVASRLSADWLKQKSPPPWSPARTTGSSKRSRWAVPSIAGCVSPVAFGVVATSSVVLVESTVVAKKMPDVAIRVAGSSKTRRCSSPIVLVPSSVPAKRLPVEAKLTHGSSKKYLSPPPPSVGRSTTRCWLQLPAVPL